MPNSTFDDLMKNVAIPAIEDIFGIAAVHTNSYAEEIAVIVIVGNDLIPVGEFGERMEFRTTIEVAKTLSVSIGDTFAIENDPTDDDSDPDPTIWKTTQLLTDDGYIQKFAVIEETT